MNIKCQWCQKDLEPIQDSNDLTAQLTASINDSALFTLECPDIHCSVTLELREGHEDRIVSYYFFLDAADGKRYKVKGNRGANTTSFLIKRQSPVRNSFSDHPWYDCPLTIKRYLAFKPNKETGILEGDAIFRRLKNLVIFS